MEVIVNFASWIYTQAQQVPVNGWVLIFFILFLLSLREGQRNRRKQLWMERNKNKGVYKLVYLKKKRRK